MSRPERPPLEVLVCSLQSLYAAVCSCTVVDIYKVSVLTNALSLRQFDSKHDDVFLLHTAWVAGLDTETAMKIGKSRVLITKFDARSSDLGG